MRLAKLKTTCQRVNRVLNASVGDRDDDATANNNAQGDMEMIDNDGEIIK